MFIGGGAFPITVIISLRSTEEVRSTRGCFRRYRCRVFRVISIVHTLIAPLLLASIMTFGKRIRTVHPCLQGPDLVREFCAHLLVITR